MVVLVIDVGGTHVKVLARGHRSPVKIPSGRTMAAHQMVRLVTAATAGWSYDVISIGYPGVVLRGQPSREPANLGPGWVGFDFAGAFGRPVRVINDAAMQALGSYRRGRMLFLGLGTGLGTALILDGQVQALELAHLPYRKSRSYEDYLGDAGRKRLGRRRWRRHVLTVLDLFREAFHVDDVVVGGGNVKRLDRLPAGVRRGRNGNAYLGGVRLWEPAPFSTQPEKPGARG